MAAPRYNPQAEPFCLPAGSDHLAALLDYLRQPFPRWQAGTREPQGACYIPVAARTFAERGSRRSTGGAFGRHVPLTIRQRLDLLADLLDLRERAGRRDVMRAARYAEAYRRQGGMPADWQPEPLPSLLDSFRADVKRGSLPRFSARVTERRRIPHPTKGRGHWLDCGTLAAPGWAVWQERLYLDHLAGWRMTEAVMRQPGKGGATLLRAPSSVNAPSISASRRQRVADSHDARPANPKQGQQGRSTQRPYSRAQFGRDVAAGKPRMLRDADLPAGSTWQAGGTCRSITVSSRRLRERGSAAALAAAQGGGRTWQPFSAPEQERGRKGGAAAPSAAESRRARQRAIVGSLRQGDGD